MESPSIHRKKAFLTVAMPLLALSIGFLMALGAGLFDTWEDRLQDLATSGSMIKGTESKEGLSIPFETLDQGAGDIWRGEEALFIRSESEWIDRMAARVGPGEQKALPPIPRIDWDRQDILLVSMKDQAGYGIEITGARQHGEALVVEVAKVEAETPVDTITAPYHLVAMDKVNVKNLRVKRLWETPDPEQAP